MTTGRIISLGKSFRLDKRGRLVRDQRRLAVSERLRQHHSKRVRVVRGEKHALKEQRP
jgi:hypothetical protein